MIFLTDFVSASVPPRNSLRNSSFLTLGRLPRKDILWVASALRARGSASTEEILPDDKQVYDFCVGCQRQFSRELRGTPAALEILISAALEILRAVLIFSFRILRLLVGRHLVGQVCVARMRLLR